MCDASGRQSALESVRQKGQPPHAAQTSETEIEKAISAPDLDVKKAPWPLNVDGNANLSERSSPRRGITELMRECEVSGDEDRRRDPKDGVWRTYRELAEVYGNHYSQGEIDAYWEYMQQGDVEAQM